MPNDRHLDRQPPLPKCLIALGLPFLSGKRSDLCFDLSDHVLQASQVPLRVLEAPRGGLTAVLVLPDLGSLLEEMATLLCPIR